MFRIGELTRLPQLLEVSDSSDKRTVSMKIGMFVILLTLFALPGFSSPDASYILDISNGGVPGAGPYAQVDLTLNTTTHDIDFVLTPFSPYLLIDQFDWNGSAGTLSLVSPATGFTLAGSGAQGAYSADGYGKFAYEIDISGASGSSNPFPNPFAFTVSNGGTFSSVFDLIKTTSAAPEFFAAHVTQVGSNCGGSPCTGFVSTDSTVPEPGFYGALALGLVGLYTGIRRRRSVA